jgi:hypothetical protein
MIKNSYWKGLQCSDDIADDEIEALLEKIKSDWADNGIKLLIIKPGEIYLGKPSNPWRLLVCGHPTRMLSLFVLYSVPENSDFPLHIVPSQYSWKIVDELSTIEQAEKELHRLFESKNFKKDIVHFLVGG